MSFSGAWMMNPKWVSGSGYAYTKWKKKFAWYPIWSFQHHKFIWLKSYYRRYRAPIITVSAGDNIVLKRNRQAEYALNLFEILKQDASN